MTINTMRACKHRGLKHSVFRSSNFKCLYITLVIISVSVLLLLQEGEKLVNCSPFELIRMKLEVAEKEANLNDHVPTPEPYNNNNNHHHPPSHEQMDPIVAETGSSSTAGLQPVTYLKKFGYLSTQPAENEEKAEARRKKAIRLFQSFARIPISDTIDTATTRIMQLARCGNKDMEEREGDFEDKINGNKWNSRSISYKISSYPTNLRNKNSEVDRIFLKAFEIWSEVVPLNFMKRTEDSADIEIKFVKGDHKCPDGPLKAAGPTSSVAHSFGPSQAGKANPLDGDIHFNDYLPWALNSSLGYNLLATAVHHIGHSLGLEHSRFLAARMSPFEMKNSTLHSYDVAALQKIYGVKRPSKTNHESLYEIKRKVVPDDQRYWYNASGVSSYDECSAFAINNKINFTIWNEESKNCSVMITQAQDWTTLYNGNGIALGHYDIYGFDLDTSELVTDLNIWLSKGDCDLILKLDNWPSWGRVGYKCKIFKDHDCCSMLLRKGKAPNLANLM